MRLHHLTLGLGLVAALLCATPSVRAADAVPAAPATDATKPLRDELDKLRKEASQLKEEAMRLREEAAVLRRENQQLRRLLAEKAENTGTNTVSRGSQATPKAPGAAPGDPALAHWLSTLSGKRHNSGCRYFKTTEGSPCRATDGTACKICGG